MQGTVNVALWCQGLPGPPEQCLEISKLTPGGTGWICQLGMHLVILGEDYMMPNIELRPET